MELHPISLPTALLFLLVKRQKGDEGMDNALHLLEEMKVNGITPDTITYSSAISACAKAERNDAMHNAHSLLKEMKDLEIKPDTITYNSAISACGNSKSHEGMRQHLPF